MNDSNESCPFCNSRNIQIDNLKDLTNIPFGPVIEFDKSILRCKDCDEYWGDEENDEKYLEEIEEGEKASLGGILDYLNQQGFSQAYMERALHLPNRTIARWKSQNFSSVGLSLMRLIRLYPWMLKVADENYDEKTSRQELVYQAGNIINNIVEKDRWEIKVDFTSANPTNFKGTFTGTKVNTLNDDCITVEGKIINRPYTVPTTSSMA